MDLANLRVTLHTKKQTAEVFCGCTAQSARFRNRIGTVTWPAL